MRPKSYYSVAVIFIIQKLGIHLFFAGDRIWLVGGKDSLEIVDDAFRESSLKNPDLSLREGLEWEGFLWNGEPAYFEPAEYRITDTGVRLSGGTAIQTIRCDAPTRASAKCFQHGQWESIGSLVLPDPKSRSRSTDNAWVISSPGRL